MNDIVPVKYNTLTPSNDYIPQPAEERILETLLNPESLGKNVTEKCKMAKVSRAYYYDVIKKPEFKELLAQRSRDLIADKLSDVINAVYKFAISNAQNHQDRRMMLEMGGVISKDNEGNKILIVNLKDNE